MQYPAVKAGPAARDEGLIAKALVDNPDEVAVSEVGGKQTIILELRVAQKDFGKVIGKQWRTVRAIRTIVLAAGMESDRAEVGSHAE